MAEQFPVSQTDLSSKEFSALEQFRKIAAELPNMPERNDRYYLRWLRARKFDVPKSTSMLQKHLEYRALFEADTILEWSPPEVLINCFPGGFFGEDKDGHPVWYDCMGNLDFRGLHRSVSKEDIRKLKCLHAVQCDQLLRECSAKHGKPIETVVSIVDFENLSRERHFYLPGLELLKQVLSDVESNCPERIKKVFIVKAPAIFPFCYNIVKHIFDEKTRTKIQVLGSNYKSVLLEYINADQLPEAYGGTCCDPDPLCSTYIHPGCDVPSHYYLTNCTKTSRDQMSQAEIGRGASFKVHEDVVEAGSVLRWEFISIDYDIAFGVSVTSDGKKQELVAMHRCESHIVPEVGQHICLIPGRYTLKFDNSYSWTRSKEIFYSVSVTLPQVNSET